MSDLEESIEAMLDEIISPTYPERRQRFGKALHAFAAAIQGEKKPTCIDHDINMNCWCGKKQPTPELPEDVKIQISRLVWLEATMDDKIFMRAELEKFAHLCLSMRAK